MYPKIILKHSVVDFVYKNAQAQHDNKDQSHGSRFSGLGQSDSDLTVLLKQ